MSYSARLVDDLPPLPQVEFQVPGGLGTVQLQLVVEPNDLEPWVGLFRSLGYSEVNDAFVWPSGVMLLVVAAGFGHYFVAREPSQRTELPVFPVRHAIRYRDQVILGDFTRLCSVDGEGIRWVTPTLASDWLDDVRVEGNRVLGRGNIASTGGWADFSVDAHTGAVESEWSDDDQDL